MGVHTGDCVTVAPQQSLTDALYQKLRDQAIAVIRAVGVETGGSNVQFAVNPETDEIVVIEMNPRVSRSSRAGLQGHGLPDRQDRRAARGRLHARRDPQRHHARHAGELRADDRLRGRQVAALRVREVPRRRPAPVDAHEERGGGDGHRPHLPAGVREGDALARARRRPPTASGRPTTCSTACGSPAPTASTSSSRSSRAASPSRRSTRRPASTRGSCASCRRWRTTPRARSRASAPSSPSTPARPSSPPRRRTTTRAGSARPATRSAAATSRA